MRQHHSTSKRAIALYAPWKRLRIEVWLCIWSTALITARVDFTPCQIVTKPQQDQGEVAMVPSAIAACSLQY